MKEFIRTMKALSDPSRVKIIKLLGQREMCVCEIQVLLELAQPTISKHLKILEDADLVRSRKEGQWVNYRLPEEPANDYTHAMLAHLDTWLDESRQITELLAKARGIDRKQLCRKA